MKVYVGPTPLFDLGQVGELDLLGALDGDVVVPAAVADELTIEPVRTALARADRSDLLDVAAVESDETERARHVLNESTSTADVRIIEGVLVETSAERNVGVVAGDRRLRTVAEGLGATVTGAFGVVVRAAAEDKYIKPDQAKRIARRLDSHGLHMTGEMRERAVGVDR
jgi:predicted nucleic acid-binding protein